MQDFLVEIETFFLSEGTAGGFIGAFLILSASYFTEVGFRLRNLTVSHKLLFMVAGTLSGALLHYTKEIGMLYSAAVGCGWPYVAISFKKAIEAFSTAF